MELFTFVRMGASKDRIKVEYLSFDDTVLKGMKTFDVGMSQCFLKSDKERLLAVIESCFGMLAPFNSRVRDLFVDASGPRFLTAIEDEAEIIQPREIAEMPAIGFVAMH